jgi:hypothetical protein
MAAMWTIITRHPEHPEGRWNHDGAVYETREQAVDAAHDAWDGTGVTWRLMTIPLDDPKYSEEQC